MDEATVAVTAIGRDRAGIVAGVTGALYEGGCNLADATSTNLGGHFAMVLLVRPPANMDAPAVEALLSDVAGDLQLVITARPVEVAGHEIALPTHMISVYGADRPGIVFRVADLLAGLNANITDLTSRVIGDEDHPVYALMLEVSLGAPDEAEEALRRLASELDVEITLHPLDADLL